MCYKTGCYLLQQQRTYRRFIDKYIQLDQKEIKFTTADISSKLGGEAIVKG